MQKTQAFLLTLKLPQDDEAGVEVSHKLFPDGGQYRIEIPSCEGPEVFRAVLAAADEYEVPIHRVSQGSGTMLLSKKELSEMVRIGHDQHIEVCLFVGPRAQWEIGAQIASKSGAAVGCQHRGADQLKFAVEDVCRACDFGIRSVLVADIGLIWVLNQMKREGQLPRNLVLKSSVELPIANPATAKVFEQLGISTINIVTDLCIPQVGAIRRAVDIPIDQYVEVPESFGGFLRYYEMPQLLDVAAPIYFKFGVRNDPGLYPAGIHLRDTECALGQERVRRARIGLEMLNRYRPEAQMSPVGSRHLGIPEV